MKLTIVFILFLSALGFSQDNLFKIEVNRIDSIYSKIDTNYNIVTYCGDLKTGLSYLFDVDSSVIFFKNITSNIFIEYSYLYPYSEFINVKNIITESLKRTFNFTIRDTIFDSYENLYLIRAVDKSKFERSPVNLRWGGGKIEKRDPISGLLFCVTTCSAFSTLPSIFSTIKTKERKNIRFIVEENISGLYNFYIPIKKIIIENGKKIDIEYDSFQEMNPLLNKLGIQIDLVQRSQKGKIITFNGINLTPPFVNWYLRN